MAGAGGFIASLELGDPSAIRVAFHYLGLAALDARPSPWQCLEVA